MTSKRNTQKLSLKKPYSLRRLRLSESNSKNRTAATPNLSSWANPDESDEDDEQIVDFIDNIAIYSFSNMRKLKNFYTQNQLKLAEDKIVASQDEEMNKYLKKLDDNISTEQINTLKHEEIVWQPNIKKTKPTKLELRDLNYSRSTSTTLSEDSILENYYDEDFPECGKAHCKLGCICDPLYDIGSTDNYSSDISESRKLERTHCGRVECMFLCNCTRKLRRKTIQKSKDINETTKKQKQQSISAAKKTEEIDENRRMSKRLKSAICQNYRDNPENETNGNNTNTQKMKSRSKSILNSSIVSSKSNSSNYECTRSSSEESQVNKQTGINSSSDETDLNQTTEPSLNEPAATRKSKRVKQLNKKFAHSMNNNQMPSSFNDFYYYSTNKHLKPPKNKFVNNQVTDGYVTKKEKPQKSINKTQKVDTSKEINQVDENTEIVNHENELFKSYSKNVSLKITNTRNMHQSDPSSMHRDFTKMPLTIQVFTNLWESDSQLRMQALRQIAKLLQNSVTKWTNFEFECDKLTIKLSNTNPVTVKVSNSQRTQGFVNVTKPPTESILSLNDLVSTSYKIRSKLIHNESENFLKNSHHMTRPAYQACSYQQSITPVKPLQNQLNHQQLSPTKTKSLPRLISRNRSHKQIDSNNKTGILLKQVDSLFKQIQSSQVNRLESSEQVDKFDKISPAILNLQKDEKVNESYNPFADNELILGMYKSNESRGLVDTVCSMVNDMVTACCKLEEKHKQTMLEKPKIALNTTHINLGQKTNIIDIKKTSKYPVTLTTIKKTFSEQSKPIIHTFTPSITNTTSGNLNETIKLSNFQPNRTPATSNSNNTNKKSLVYQIISSNDQNKKQNLIQLIKNEQPKTSSNDNYRSNLPVTSNIKPNVSTFKFDDEIIENEIEPTTPIKRVNEDQQQISTIKTILPSSTIGNVKYKTLVKIVTPEKNNPEGGPKIKISSSYVMPAHSCIPGVAKSTSSDQNVTVPKLIKMAINENQKLIIPANKNKYLSSFVPIRPKQQQDSQSSQSGYLKSIVCPIPIVLPADNKTKVINKSRFGGFTERQVTSVTNTNTSGYESIPGPKKNAIITLVVPNGSQKSTDTNNLEANTNDLEEQDRQKYIEIRKRKRKQDLTSLKSQQPMSLYQFDENQQMSSDEADIRDRFKMNRLAIEDEMKSSLNQFKPSFENKLENVFKIQRMPLLLKNRRKRDFNLNQNYKPELVNNQPSYLIPNKTYNNIPKNFSSSPDSNESLYSTSTLLQNEQNYFDHKSALVTYKEDSDDDYFDTNCSTYKFNNFNEQDLHPIDNDVIEIDSEPSNDNEYSIENSNNIQKRTFEEFIGELKFTGELNDYCLFDDEYNIERKKYKQSIENDSDSSDSSLPVVTFSSKGLEKSTINNIHSIRERQRRLKLKNLLMKLKIQLFECESETKYDLDNSVSQKELEDYCNTRNFNKKSLKSKQNILQEAVNLIKNLQNEQSSLELMLLGQKIELEKNIGIRNYLMKVNSSSS